MVAGENFSEFGESTAILTKVLSIQICIIKLRA